MNRVLNVTILLGCSVAATTAPLVFAGGQTGSNNQGNGGVQEAIRFERAKDAADARQARIEVARPNQGAQTNGAIATGSASERDRGVIVRDPGVQEAIRFERSKDAADARQARIDAGQATDNAVAGSADRRITGHQ
jgi:hypothetical protein